jgi:Zn2+/Cd2+-exporting ATPase
MTTDIPLDSETRRRLGLLFVATALMLAAVLSGWLRPEQELVRQFLALIAALIVAIPIVSGLIHAIRATGFAATQFYMDQYVVLALAACLATGKYLTGAIVAIVLLFGQMLEERTTVGVEMALAKLRQLSRVRAKRLIKSIEENCQKCRRIIGLRSHDKFRHTTEEIEANQLNAGDEILILPGEAVPADATILTGHALIDQSTITGESVPIEVGPGSEIFAGTNNLNGAIEARVTGTGEDTVMGRVQSIIEEAKKSESPIISLAEDYARYYTPLILLIAASVFFFTQEIERAIAVLVVAIPCAFVLASPSAMVSAIAAASRMGLLVKSVRHLESARLTDTVVFDKTGTLTEGKLELEETAVHSPNYDDYSVLRLAAAIESQSNHPIARAISQLVPENERPIVTALTEYHGLGLEGIVEGKTILIGRPSFLEKSGVSLAIDPATHTRHSLVLIAVDGTHAATFLLADRIRAEAKETLDHLRSLGISDFVMLTGDRTEVAETIAACVGITDFKANCLPQDKVDAIRALKAAGRKVMVVGDGLNDAPALAEGDLGVAMGALGNDVTVHTSDVALMSGDLRRLADLLLLSSKTVNIINQNLLCGFAFIIIATALSSLGYVNPIAAAFFHEFSAFFVIFNSARLIRFDGIEQNHVTTVQPAETEYTALA